MSFGSDAVVSGSVRPYVHQPGDGGRAKRQADRSVQKSVGKPEVAGRAGVANEKNRHVPSCGTR